MRKLGIAAIVLGALGFATPAAAGPGQCYDAYGRPIGPVYDTDYPNYAWINSVVRRGGSCTGVRPEYNPDSGYYARRRYYREYNPYPYPYRYGYGFDYDGYRMR